MMTKLIGSTLRFCGVAILGFTALASATTFDAVAAFSSVSNPNGPWSYGQTPTLGGGFSLLTAGTCGSLSGWQSAGNVPWVLGAPGGGTCGTGVDPANMLDLHPGINGEYAIVRFTVATLGSYTIAGSFQGIDRAPTTTDVHVLKNGVSIFDGAITTFGVPLNFNLAGSLLVGDTIDFAVGRGADNAAQNDSTGLAASLTTGVPEPGSLAMLGMGLAAVVAGLRRKR